jgi:hypothetical protein
MPIIKIRRGTSEQWSTSTKVLQVGELGIDVTLNKIKAGNGTSTWTLLPWLTITANDLTTQFSDTLTDANEYTDTAVSSLGDTLDGAYVPISDVGNAGGVASLDIAGKIPDSEIPDSIARDSEIITSYNNLTDKPTIFSGSYDDLSNKPTIPSLAGYATETYVSTAISNLIDAAPTSLNTLNELAAALGDDANYASTITTTLGTKAPLASPTFTGNVTIGEAITKTTSTAITSSSATTIATFPVTDVIAAECIILISNTSNGSYYASKVLITADPYINAEADITEYAINSTKDFDLFPVITATISGENLLLRAAVSSFGATTAKVVSTSILGPLGSS